MRRLESLEAFSEVMPSASGDGSRRRKVVDGEAEGKRFMGSSETRPDSVVRAESSPSPRPGRKSVLPDGRQYYGSGESTRQNTRSMVRKSAKIYHT